MRICSGYNAPCHSTDYIKYSCTAKSSWPSIPYILEKLIATSIIQQLDIGHGIHFGLVTFGWHTSTLNHITHFRTTTCQLLESLWNYSDWIDDRRLE
ncbi:hypothetical protein OSTOST_11609, partial [Ostertagia ostertagi]